MTTIHRPAARARFRTPAVVAGTQLAMLAVLAVAHPLGAAGWLAGAGYIAVVSAALAAATHRAGTSALGLANQVTLVRSALVAAVAALVGDVLDGRAAPLVPLLVLGGAALGLDALDGWVARRTGCASALGARFDVEVDAGLVLVLSVLVAAQLGAWVLAIGAARYLFVAAGWCWPWLRGGLPVSYLRKAIGSLQGVALLLSMAVPGAGAVVVVALGLLVFSFGRDVVWLWRAG